MPILVAAVADATRAALVVNGGGGPPLPCPVTGILHVASDCPGVHGVAAEDVNVSWPKLPVSSDVLIKRFPVVFRYAPAGAVTLTVIVQLLFPASVPLTNETDVAPANGTGKKAPGPQPLYVTPGVAATCMPAGKVSVKLAPVNVSAVGFVNFKVIVEVPPGEIARGVNVFDIVTDDGLTMFAVRNPTE